MKVLLTWYHPRLGFLVDGCAGGAWSDDRRQAQVFASQTEANAALNAAVSNGMGESLATECMTLRFIFEPHD
jgi:hypothetical protein